MARRGQAWRGRARRGMARRGLARMSFPGSLKIRDKIFYSSMVVNGIVLFCTAM